MKRKLKISAIPTSDRTHLDYARLLLCGVVSFEELSDKTHNTIVRWLNQFAKTKK